MIRGSKLMLCTHEIREMSDIAAVSRTRVTAYAETVRTAPLTEIGIRWMSAGEGGKQGVALS